MELRSKEKTVTNSELLRCLKQLCPKLQEILNKEGYSLCHASFSRENEINYLRLTINHQEENISLDDCELVSREIEKMLDRDDPIPFPYTLEVQSRGLNGQLTDSDCSFSIESLGFSVNG